MMAPVVERIRAVYDLRRAGGITDAEARWIMDILLRDYGLTVEGLARLMRNNGT